MLQVPLRKLRLKGNKVSYSLNELIEKLQDLAEDHPELADQQVNVAFQPNYPLAALITSVTVLENKDDCDCPDTKSCEDCEAQLWIGIKDNSRIGYAPGEAWND